MVWRPVGNERGSALIITVLVLLLLTIIGLSATTGTDTELLIAGNEKQAAQNFFNASAGTASAMEVPTGWLTSAYLISINNELPVLQDGATAPADFKTALGLATSTPYQVTDQSGNPIATITVSPVFSAASTGNQDAVSQTQITVATQPYSAVPPVGSGYGLGKFIIHRYAVTSTATTQGGGTVKVQVGVWKAFNK